jgi:hypothetical protein
VTRKSPGVSRIVREWAEVMPGVPSNIQLPGGIAGVLNDLIGNPDTFKLSLFKFQVEILRIKVYEEPSVYTLYTASQDGPRNGQLQAEMESSYCLTAMATGQGKMWRVNFLIHLSQ